MSGLTDKFYTIRDETGHLIDEVRADQYEVIGGQYKFYRYGDRVRNMDALNGVSEGLELVVVITKRRGYTLTVR